VEKTSIRLAPEVEKKLADEARRQSEMRGETVTVSEVMRACIAEKFPQVSARGRGENAAVVELREEVLQLKERHGLLAQDLEKLVETLSEMFKKLATREQVDSLTDGIAAVIRSLKGR